MKRIFSTALSVCFLLAAISATSQANPGKLELQLKNQTPYTLNKIVIAGKSGSLSSSELTFAPGGQCIFGLDGFNGIASVKISTGVGNIEFTGIPALQSGLVEGKIFFNSDNKPVLALGGQGQVDSANQGEIQVEAGPIWNNDNSQERCPEVLAQWHEEHPEQKAEWTGHWMTTVPNEMSVCVLRIIGKQSVTSAPSTANEVLGTYSVLLREGESGGMTLTDLMAAQNLTEVRALSGLPPAKEMSNEDTILEVKVRFADQTWMAMVYPEKTLGSFGSFDESSTAPGKVFLTAYASEESRKKTVESLREMAWKPWFIQTMSGANFKVTATDKLFENDDEDAVWSKVLTDFTTLGDLPFEVSCIFFSADNFEIANAGHTQEMPALAFKAGAAKNMRLEFFHDGFMFVQITRR